MPKINLTRESAFSDKLRAYKVMVDDHERASVKESESVEIDVAPGEHRVWIKIDWARSNILTLDVNGDVKLRCKSNVNPFFALFALFNPSGWVKIWRM